VKPSSPSGEERTRSLDFAKQPLHFVTTVWTVHHHYAPGANCQDNVTTSICIHLPTRAIASHLAVTRTSAARGVPSVHQHAARTCDNRKIAIHKMSICVQAKPTVHSKSPSHQLLSPSPPPLPSTPPLPQPPHQHQHNNISIIIITSAPSNIIATTTAATVLSSHTPLPDH
jgi:hypothetical protein